MAGCVCLHEPQGLKLVSAIFQPLAGSESAPGRASAPQVGEESVQGVGYADVHTGRPTDRLLHHPDLGVRAMAA